MSGVAAGSFGPNVDLSRAMLAQMVYAMEGKPAVSGASGFSDVPANEWFASAVNWAAAQGVVAGTGGSQYSPNSPPDPGADGPDPVQLCQVQGL